jgi:hypothetical protein
MSTIYAVTAAGRDLGTLELDMDKLTHERWRWVSATGAVVEFFPTKTAAKDRLAWLNRCRPIDVELVEQQPRPHVVQVPFHGSVS